MSNSKCNKKSTKNRVIAVANTLRRKQLRLYHTAIRQPDNLQVMDAFIQSVHPEGIISWLRRVQP